ncbi:COG1470 family protein [Streptomyces sp. URMC 128]|uniref:COG1470 family protein n=1 Tax=Streptomyces sp. URMC 128 TaxID=3423404 RepID=UPI003F52CD0A
MLTDVPGGDVTVGIDGGDGTIKVQLVRVSEFFERPFTEAEILDLSAFPPSIRENARRYGRVAEEIELARGDGATPMTVPGQATLSITLSASLNGTSTAVVSGRLIVDSTSWGPVTAPVFCLVGDPNRLPSVEPDAIKCSLEPGQSVTRQVVISETPSSTSVLAYIAGGDKYFRLKSIVALRSVQLPYTEEEILDLPPYPPSIRENARRYGHVEYQESGRTNGPGTLQVAVGSVLRFDIECVAPHPHFHDRKTATLMIDAPDWQRVEAHLEVIAGKIDVSLIPSALTVRQGGTGQITATFGSVSGPGTHVHLVLVPGEETWQVDPAKVFVPQGQTVTTPLTVRVHERAPVGMFPVQFEVRAFDERQSHKKPFDLTVRPAPVTVRALQETVVVPRGGRTTFPVEVRSDGGYKRLTLTGLGVPWGVHVLPASRELGYGAETTVIPVDVIADSQGPQVTNYLTSVDWDAGDGENKGRIWLNTTVSRLPETRTFTHQITTPEGTALGGWAELTIRSDGSTRFRGHMHDSGLDSYAFRVGVVVRSPDGTAAIAALKSGTVTGTLGVGSRDYDWDDADDNTGLKDTWETLRDGSAQFTKWYEDTGALGFLEDFAAIVVEFIAVNLVAGPVAAMVLVVGSELGALTEIPYAHPAGLAGVLVAGGVLLLLGPIGMVPAVAAGAVAAGAVAAAELVRTRPLRESEITFAATVFKDTLPIDNILVTNLSLANDRACCTPSIDGSILLNLGSRFEAPLADLHSKKTLVHELTHAWQIAHRPPEDVESIWEVLTNGLKPREEVYATVFPLDGRPWAEWDVEHQAQMVAFWWWLAETTYGGVDTPMAVASPFFHYIQNNIRMGQP